MLRLQTCPQRGERILTQGVSGDLVLLNPNNGQYYALNEVGARIWELSDGTRSVAEMVAVIAHEYDAPRAVIEADVVELVEDLYSDALLVEGEGTPGSPATRA